MRSRFPFRRALAAGLVAPFTACLVAFAAGGGCGVGDQKCPDDTIDTDLDDSCPYGPPGGPQKPGDSCASIVFDESAECADVTFDTVFDILAGPPGNCASLGCHGSVEAALVSGDVFLDPANPAQWFEELGGYVNGNSEPYMATGNARSWILCSLKALPGGGSPMPVPGGLIGAPTELASVERWVACGMKPAIGGGTTAASTGSAGGAGEGGGGGGGGTGGAGGAGGGT